MKTKNNPFLVLLILIINFLQTTSEAYASHAQSADLTYRCLGNGQYEISVSFYRDCAGVNAPNSVSINISSISCNQNFNATLNKIAGTGIDVTQVCNQITTNCNGGTYPGVQEYIYRGTINLPSLCNDWKFSFSLCCRNNAINTINNPGNEPIYVEATLNNLDVPCNSSPTFSNPPVAYPCINQTSCFNHGAFDIDGDSLVYSLQAPATGPNTTVTYIPGYTPQQPLLSNPAVSFNSQTGDICSTPTQFEVTVLAVKVEEYRNGMFVGSVVRDIQLRTVNCNNNLPYLTGINGTNQFNTTVCAGSNITFNIPSVDLDAGQNTTLTWNNAIPNAIFTSTPGPNSSATFSWTPTTNQISNNPYCFTVTVSDDNCPLNGVQVYSFCLTVTGFSLNLSSTNANCGASNGTASVTVNGGSPPYSYQWMPNGGTNANAYGLQAGLYTVYVTDNNGCTMNDTVSVGQGAQPGNITFNTQDVNCFGGNDGIISANVNGGQQPYTYMWSNGDTTATITNLSAGTYILSVVSANGCIKSDSVTIYEPASPLTAIISTNNTSCNGANDGSASVVAQGGTPGYSYYWSQGNGNTTSINNLSAGTYSLIVTDNNGCTDTSNFVINQPPAITTNVNQLINVTCFGGNNGIIDISASGGTPPYAYQWNNGQNTNVVSGLSAGSYQVNITDANGCLYTNVYDIIEPPVLNTTAITQNISCYGYNDGNIQTTVSGGTPPYSFNWNNGQTNNNVSNLSPGNYFLTVTDNNGCTDTLTASITEPQPILITVSNDDTICPGNSTQINVVAQGGNGVFHFNWNQGLPDNSTHTVSPSSTTNYTVFITDSNGCMSNSENVNITVNDINNIVLNISPDTAVCKGELAQVYAYVSNGIGNYQLNWNNGLGMGNGPFYVTPNNTTTYQVTVTDVCNNSLNSQSTVTVNPLPNVQLAPQYAEGCGSVTLNLNNNYPSQTGDQFYWDFGDGSNSNLETPEKQFTQSGQYTITLMVTNAFGCKNQDNTLYTINVFPQSKSVFAYEAEDYTTLNNEVRFINLSSDADYYNWHFGDGITAADFEPVHSYKEKGTYKVMLITNNVYGCADTSTIDLIIAPEFTFYIPNAFTPDGDGKNELFRGYGEEIMEYEMLIFDRWGALIFTSNKLEEGWDGMVKGRPAPQGVYVYKVKVKDNNYLYHQYTGQLSLLK